jgi:hypothetical protein
MLKPKKADVYLIYECPSCNCEWTKTPKEVILLKAMVCEGCGSYIKFAPIEQVKVVPVYKGSIVKTTPKIEPASLIQQDAISALVNLGFPKRESKDFVLAHKFASIEDYIQAAVRKGTM